MSELWQHGAGALAALIRSGEVTSREVVDAHFRRIEATNARLNAVTVVLEESARDAADAADRAIAAGHPVGPLCGVPMTIKENIDVAGSATTHGLAVLENATAVADAPPVAELRRAGAIPIALAAVGYAIRLDGLSGRVAPLAVGLGFRLVVAPLALLGVFAALGHLGDRATQIAIFEMAMPPMLGASLIAMDHDLEPELVGLLIGIGIPLSMLVVPLWWSLLH